MRVSAMGIGIGDLNGDQRSDFVISEVNRFHAMMAGPTGDFWYDASTATGLQPHLQISQKVGWGTELVDMDNDGLLDVVTVFGPTEDPLNSPTAPDRQQPDGVWLQQTDGTFVDVAPEWGVDHTTMGRGLIASDLNGDGWLDLARTDYRTGPAHIWYARCGNESWLLVDLEGGNFGYGAKVEAIVGDQVMTRWHSPSNTSMATSAPVGVHFGLGDAEVVDELIVTWADGSVSQFADIPTKQRVTVQQVEGPLLNR